MAQCIVYGCTNKTHEGEFIGDLCFPCYKIITQGDTEQPSSNFIHKLHKENEKLKEALTPSGETKSFHIGEYSFQEEMTVNDEGYPITENIKISVPWTTIKDIMKNIKKYALGE